MALANLHDLMIHELKDIYNAERQLVAALPRVAKRANSESLQKALLDHLAETQNQVSRLEQVFEMLGQPAKSRKCEGMQGLIDEAKELMDEDVEPDVLDAGLIGAAQKVEHYEIAAYGTVCAYAKSVGRADVAQLLEETLEEEKAADRLLSELAEGGINQLAEREAGGEEEDGEVGNGTGNGGNGRSTGTRASRGGSRARRKTASRKGSSR
jgi:ferritin-like metal-binding protein YciE